MKARTEDYLFAAVLSVGIKASAPSGNEKAGNDDALKEDQNLLIPDRSGGGACDSSTKWAVLGFSRLDPVMLGSVHVQRLIVLFETLRQFMHLSGGIRRRHKQCVDINSNLLPKTDENSGMRDNIVHIPLHPQNIIQAFTDFKKFLSESNVQCTTYSYDALKSKDELSEIYLTLKWNAIVNVVGLWLEDCEAVNYIHEKMNCLQAMLITFNLLKPIPSILLLVRGTLGTPTHPRLGGIWGLCRTARLEMETLLGSMVPLTVLRFR